MKYTIYEKNEEVDPIKKLLERIRHLKTHYNITIKKTNINSLTFDSLSVLNDDDLIFLINKKIFQTSKDGNYKMTKNFLTYLERQKENL